MRSSSLACGASSLLVVLAAVSLPTCLPAQEPAARTAPGVFVTPFAAASFGGDWSLMGVDGRMAGAAVEVPVGSAVRLGMEAMRASGVGGNCPNDFPQPRSCSETEGWVVAALAAWTPAGSDDRLAPFLGLSAGVVKWDAGWNGLAAAARGGLDARLTRIVALRVEARVAAVSGAMPMLVAGLRLRLPRPW